MSANVVVIDDEVLIRKSLTKVLRARGYRVETAATGSAGVDLVERIRPQVAILDMRLPDTDGLSVLRKVKAAAADTQVIVITAFGDVDSAVEAMKLGAADFVRKPYELDEITLAVESAAQAFARENELEAFKRTALDRVLADEIIGESPPMVELRELLAKVAASEATTVLIEGESGTGKELAARALHYRSERAEFPLVEVNCSQFQEPLLNNELFGHEKGAYTDAREVKKGLVELCDRGTLFLDEVGDMPLGTQAMLLRFIDQRQFKRVGGTENISVDLRIVTATNKRLAEEVQRERFREDLYYRLKVVTVTLPPLRERGDDVLRLARHFLAEFSRKFKKDFVDVAPDAAEALLRYAWPGNVRQLRNLVERIVLLESGPRLLAEHLPPEILDVAGGAGAALRPGESLSLAQIEERHIRQVMRMTDGNKSQAARVLGISRPTLIEKLKRMGGDPDVKQRDM
jgi:two-component system, NtrC family, response regulator AtoC